MKLVDNEIVIREVKNEDLHSLWKLLYHDDLEWMNWNGPYFNDPVYTETQFIEDIGPKHYVQQPHCCLIEIDNVISGTVSCHFEDGKLAQWLEFGIVVHNSTTWGKGIGTRSLKLWMQYLFERHPYLQRIGFTTWSGNVRMMKLGEHLGMKQEACIRKVRFYQGQYYDSIKYGILREEFMKTLQ